VASVNMHLDKTKVKMPSSSVCTELRWRDQSWRS